VGKRPRVPGGSPERGADIRPGIQFGNSARGLCQALKGTSREAMWNCSSHHKAPPQVHGSQQCDTCPRLESSEGPAGLAASSVI
jgi:hypothetical protein